MSEGKDINVTTAKTYETEDSPFFVKDPPLSSQWLSVAVQLKTKAGYKSRMSEVISFPPHSGKHDSKYDFKILINCFLIFFL